MRLRSKLFVALLLVMSLMLAGCSSDLAGVEITTTASVVDVGDEVSLSVVGISTIGTKIDIDQEPVWSTTNGTITAVGENQAVFTPSEEGAVTLTVTVGEFSGSLTVNVGERILAVSALDYVAQGGGEVQLKTDRTYPTYSHWNNLGHYLEWEFEVPKAGYYTPIIMYSTGARYDVFRSVSVDGELVLPSVEFPNTGGFGSSASQWNTAVLEPIYLETGKRNIHIENIVPDVETGMNPAWIALVRPAEVANTADIVQRINAMLGL